MNVPRESSVRGLQSLIGSAYQFGRSWVFSFKDEVGFGFLKAVNLCQRFETAITLVRYK